MESSTNEGSTNEVRMNTLKMIVFAPVWLLLGAAYVVVNHWPKSLY